MAISKNYLNASCNKWSSFADDEGKYLDNLLRLEKSLPNSNGENESLLNRFEKLCKRMKNYFQSKMQGANEKRKAIFNQGHIYMIDHQNKINKDDKNTIDIEDY